MAGNRVNVTLENGSILEVEKGTKIHEIAKFYEKNKKEPIVGAKINGEIISMDLPITKNTTIEFLDMTSTDGMKLTRKGLTFVAEVALKEVYKNDFELIINHSIAHGLHMTVVGNRKFTLQDAQKLKEKMNEIIQADEPILEVNVDKEQAIDYFNKVKATEKSANIHNVTNDIVTVYKLRNYINYFYSKMPYKTGCLKKYNLVFLDNNKLVLLFPARMLNLKVPEYVHYQNIIECYERGNKWLEQLGIPYLSDLNRKISECKIKDVIKIVETKFDNDMFDLVNDVIAKKARYILLAGPSSSGKTTTTKRIALQLRSRGYDALVLSTDNYFKERVDSPRDAEGHYDFECLECIDLKLLNKQLKDLLAGKKVAIPEFNFVTGKKEYNSEPIKITDKTIILMEGLHCINDAMTPDIPAKLKYKVYLSPFIPLSIDRHNYISSTDLRLMRRIVRDNRSRAYDVGVTITYWNKVKAGEQKHIYPFTNKVDKVLNTSLIYEIGVLKVFVEPLLYSVKPTSPAYNEARRIINSLRGFFPIPSEYVPGNSIEREFIGNSEFENYN